VLSNLFFLFLSALSIITLVNKLKEIVTKKSLYRQAICQHKKKEKPKPPSARSSPGRASFYI